MFFFIIWGNKVKTPTVGCVSDKCPCCHAVRPFEIVEVRKIPHVYYIPLGSGEVVGTFRRCAQCRAEYPCATQHYDRVLPIEQMGMMSPMELARRTNMRVVEEVERMDELKRMASGQSATVAADTAPPAPDAEFLAVYELLRDHADEPEAGALLAQAQMWASLPAEARTTLRRQAEAFVEDKRQWSAASEFAVQMTRKTPALWGGWIAALSFIGIFTLALWLGIAFGWAQIAVLGIVLAFVSIIVAWPINANLRRKWVEQQLLPKARESKIVLPRLLTVLEVLARKQGLPASFATLGSCHGPLRTALNTSGEGADARH